ncbi:MAG: hypothetical protein GF364_19425 [Candidatus Lokiarchaeota archaeon]|nr:hypothetical protein [Candidatus Lokiarchaeota archaeon]
MDVENSLSVLQNRLSDFYHKLRDKISPEILEDYQFKIILPDKSENLYNLQMMFIFLRKVIDDSGFSKRNYRYFSIYQELLGDLVIKMCQKPEILDREDKSINIDDILSRITIVKRLQDKDYQQHIDKDKISSLIDELKNKASNFSEFKQYWTDLNEKITDYSNLKEDLNQILRKADKSVEDFSLKELKIFRICCGLMNSDKVGNYRIDVIKKIVKKV